MALSTIRKITDEDRERINAAAIRFINRHPELQIDLELCVNGWTAEDAIKSTLEHSLHCGYPIRFREDVQYLVRLWLNCWRRAVREPSADASGYGYIGYSVD